MTAEEMDRLVDLGKKLSMLTEVSNALQDEDCLVVDVQSKRYVPVFKFLSREERKIVNKLIKGIVSAKLDACKKEIGAL